MGLPPRYIEFIKEPTKLIGQTIKQKFLNNDDDSDSFTWYIGQILDYSAQDKTHSIKYEGEEEVYYYDLTLDFILGDILLE